MLIDLNVSFVEFCIRLILQIPSSLWNDQMSILSLYFLSVSLSVCPFVTGVHPRAKTCS